MSAGTPKAGPGQYPTGEDRGSVRDDGPSLGAHRTSATPWAAGVSNWSTFHQAINPLSGRGGGRAHPQDDRRSSPSRCNGRSAALDALRPTVLPAHADDGGVDGMGPWCDVSRGRSRRSANSVVGRLLGLPHGVSNSCAGSPMVRVPAPLGTARTAGRRGRVARATECCTARRDPGGLDGSIGHSTCCRPGGALGPGIRCRSSTERWASLRSCRRWWSRSSHR